MSELTEFRREFWAYYAERYPDDGVAAGCATSSFWVWIEAAELNLAPYVARDHVGVRVRGCHGEPAKEVHQRLQCWERSLRDRLGVEIGDATDATDGGSYANSRSFGDTSDRGNWPALTEWLHTRITEYRQILEAAPAPPAAD